MQDNTISSDNFDWEIGFTPANLKLLVATTGLKNTEFFTKFQINKVMFYNYLRGDNTLKHDKWESLCKSVKDFNEKQSTPKKKVVD